MKRICSILVGGMMAFAASTPLAAQTGHLTVVVHSDLRTGKLISSVAVKPVEVAETPVLAHDPLKETNAPAVSSNMLEMIDQIANAHNVEAPLVHSVIRAESNYNSRAMSEKGALGMMQLIPSTAHRFGVSNPFDARQNVEGGVRYLRFLLDYYNNDYPKAIAAYNAGEGAVDLYHGIPPYAETRNYVYQVAKNLRAARQSDSARAARLKAEQSAKLEKASLQTEATYNPIRASVSEDGRVVYRTQ